MVHTSVHTESRLVGLVDRTEGGVGGWGNERRGEQYNFELGRRPGVYSQYSGNRDDRLIF